MVRDDLHCFETQVRTDVSVNCPAGKNWVSVDGEYKAITVSGKVDAAIFFLVVLIVKCIYIIHVAHRGTSGRWT